MNYPKVSVDSLIIYYHGILEKVSIYMVFTKKVAFIHDVYIVSECKQSHLPLFNKWKKPELALFLF